MARYEELAQEPTGWQRLRAEYAKLFGVEIPGRTPKDA